MLITLDGSPLTLTQVAAVARGQAVVSLGSSTRERLAQARTQLERLVEDGLPHYGVNTGFGSLSRTRIPPTSSAISSETSCARTRQASATRCRPTPCAP